LLFSAQFHNVNRIASILLLFSVLGIGSGALDFLHELGHQAEDARMDAMAKAAGIPPLKHEHDDSNCDVCAQLHMISLILIGWMPMLIFLGLFIAFLTLLPRRLIPRPLPARIDCRGPPATVFSV